MTRWPSIIYIKTKKMMRAFHYLILDNAQNSSKLYSILYFIFKKLPLTATGAIEETECSALKGEGHHPHQWPLP